MLQFQEECVNYFSDNENYATDDNVNNYNYDDNATAEKKQI